MIAAAPSSSLSAEWLAHRYDPAHDSVHFIAAPRELRRRVPFLTDENLPGAASPVIVRREAAVRDAAGTARLNFIFHSAYCCSTLLGNAYDRPGSAFSLKEPVLLNDLVGWRHRQGSPAAVGQMLEAGLRLLARPFVDGEVGVVKPSNVVNGLAAAMVAARPEAGALLLYAPLDVYLGSIASKGLWGRRWVRDLLVKLLTDGLVDLGFERGDYLLHTDLQVAGVGWLAQHALFARIARAWPDRVRTLDSETLLARPNDALAAIDALFGVMGSDVDREAVVATVFRRDAKTGVPFDAGDRRAGQKSAADAYGDEITKVSAWVRAVAEGAGVALDLPSPLLGPQA